MQAHLLILEDDDALRAQLARRLARDYEVTAVASLAEALHAVDTVAQLDAALLDQNVAGDSGLDLITPLLQRFPDCRVVMHTGYGSIPAAVAATRKGAVDYLTKPATLKQILAALRGEHSDPLPATLPDAPPSLERLEWEHIQRVLDEHDGNISAAARILGIHRRTLQRRLKKRPSASDYARDRRVSGSTGDDDEHH